MLDPDTESIGYQPLKKLLAEQLLDNAVLGSAGTKLITPAARFATEKRVIADLGHSKRRASGLIGVDRSSFQYDRKTGAEACRIIEAWRRYYNEDRPHGAIGHKPPISLQNPGGAPSPPP